MQLKSFLVYEKAEIAHRNLTGDDVDELVDEIDRIIETLDSGIALVRRNRTITLAASAFTSLTLGITKNTTGTLKHLKVI